MKQHLVSRVPLKKIIFVLTLCCSTSIVGLYFLPMPFYTKGFETLQDLSIVALEINENIQPDSANTIKPDFSSYLNTLKPTWKSIFQEKILWLLSKAHIIKPPLWSPSFFKAQLDTLTALRKSKSLHGNFICKITPTKSSKIILFGNLQGAFHSLVRDLIKLKDLGLIDENLKINSSENFILFAGDVVSRSPYSMQTLSLVMQLLIKNPENVIYQRGNHETANYWEEHSLKIELQARASLLSQEAVPLAKEINTFFMTLPLATYISMLADSNSQLIRISDSGRDQINILNEQDFAQFLTIKASQGISCYELKEKDALSTSDISVDVKVIFKGEKKRETYQPHTGLRLLPSDMGSTAWTTLSCPTPVYQKAIKFIHDAFVIISPATQLDEWTITLYNRNVQTQEPFKSTTYYLLSGAEEGAQQANISTPSLLEVSKSQTYLNQQAATSSSTTVNATITPSIAAAVEKLDKQVQEIAREAHELTEKIKGKRLETIQPETTPVAPSKPEKQPASESTTTEFIPIPENFIQKD